MVDPLAELPSQIAHSPYVYAWNNPVGMIDPTGMAAEESDPGKEKTLENNTPLGYIPLHCFTMVSPRYAIGCLTGGRSQPSIRMSLRS